MPEARPPQPGDPERVGAYQITGRLAEGARGEVFLGRGPSGEPVALKLLHPGPGGWGDAARDRFVQGMEPARRVATFSTASVLEAGVEGDRPYVVSDLVEGPSLHNLVIAEGPRGRNTVERLAVGTATALTAIHRAGAVHRDLKPANILLAADGPRMTDFGLLRALESAGLPAPPGNPTFLAPEQLSGVGVGPPADVFAWGVTMLFAAIGRPPFEGESMAVVMHRILYEEPDLATLPDSLRPIVAEALAKEPSRRPTARQVLDRLVGAESPVAGMPEALVNEARTLAVPAPPVPPTRSGTPVGPGLEPRPNSTEVLPAMPGGWEADPGNPVPGFGADDGTAELPEVGPPPVGPPGGPPPVGPEPGAPPYDPQAPYDPRTSYDGYAEQNPYADLFADGPQGTSRPDPGSLRPGARRGRVINRPVGVIIALATGVLAGTAIIMLVILPMLRDDGSDGDRASDRTAADDRPVDSIPQSFAGTWRGDAVNSQRNNASFPVEVTFEAGKPSAQVLYAAPSNCSGTLTLSRGTGRRLEMRLDIDKPCTSGQVVVTKQDNGSLDYYWSRQGTALSYRATLNPG